VSPSPPQPPNSVRLQKILAAAGVEFASAEVSLVPKTVIPLEGKNAAKFVKLLEALEDHDDVQTVYANFDIPTSVMEELAAA